MREGWKNKTFGEVSEIICGQDYKSVQDENGAYPIYGTGGIMGHASQYRCPANSIIIGRKGNINNPILVEEPFWNVDTAFGVVPNISVVVPKYFYYFCRNYDFTKHDVSVTIPSLRRTDILKIEISVPSLPEQERIVAELDLLTGIIDKQKAQLKELDTLAQSIFYDMFGDPVENEKGWEMCEISSVCEDLFAGGDKPKDISEEKDDDYKYPIIGNGDGERGILGYSKSYRVGKAAVTIGARGASIGNCRICEPHFTPVVRLITLVPNKRVNLGYLYAISRKLSFNVNGAGQAQLTTPNVANKLIPVPPRELQDEYYKKIQSIESQKDSINRSIAETQKLFDYTMDKYFG